ncbi:MAG: alpha/beta hydrolase [Anaerolineae bacterium]|nr:alpha/beta hydrolase [Anaerolineae bacterium]RLC64784.1 MAG: alpha/beta hydrolase [Chloroflexota bacterium]
MSSIVTDEGVVHYEVDGRGKPVLLLHGWINSWNVWRETMLTLSDSRRYKIYALDFWGFGESIKQKTPPFRISSYVQMVDQFMEIMGIARAPVIGHSMGGTVALSLTLDHPARVEQVAVVGSPINGMSLNFWLILAGNPTLAWLVWRIPIILRFVVWMVLAGDSPEVRRMIERDLSRTAMEPFFRSIESLRKTDLRPRLGEIRVPTLGIFGRHDNIVNPSQAQVLARGVRVAQVRMMEHSRHFPMLDEPELFYETLLGFLDQARPGPRGGFR